jgi:S1-C subfamily serine protease
LGCLLLAPLARSEPPLSAEHLYQRSLPSVLTLEIEARGGAKSVGTAFLALRPGLAVTAWHLLQNAKTVSARFADAQPCEVTGLVDYDEKRDLAILCLAQTNRPVLSLCTNLPPVGQRVYTVGAPYGLEFSLTDGLVSQTRVLDGFRQYQISCPISPGNSGGPVLDDRGEVLGVVAWSQSGAQNLNFATPASYLAGLNGNRRAVAWNSREARKAPGRTKAAQPLGASTRFYELPRGLGDFRQCLRQSAGKEITITVFTDGKEQTYTFPVPPDWKWDTAAPTKPGAPQ